MAIGGLLGSIVGALIGGVTGIFGANEKNDDIERAQESARNAAALEARQNQAAASLERRKRIRESQIIRGRILASAGERGAGGSVDTDLLVGQNSQIAGFDLATIGQDLENRLALLFSERDSRIDVLDSQKQSVLSAFGIGALGGASSGLSIGGAIDQYGRTESQRQRTTNAQSEYDTLNSDLIDDLFR